MIRGRFYRSIVGLIVVMPILYWLVLFIAPETFDHIWFWFWFAKVTPIPLWWLVLVPLILILLLFYTVPQNVRSSFVALLLIALTGYAVQWSFALMEGRGVEAMTEKMLDAQIGHSAFAREAISSVDYGETIRTYYGQVKVDSLPRFPFATKPPGHFLLYIATNQVAEGLLGKQRGLEQQVEQLALFASFLWPLFTFLALFPMYGLARFFLAETESRATLILYIFSPNIVLMTMHLDQCLLPLLFLTTLYLFMKGVTERMLWLHGLAGIVAGIALFISFSMITLFPLLALWHGGRELLTKKRKGDSWGRALRRSAVSILQPLVLFAVGVLLVNGFFSIAYGYDPLAAYQLAHSEHSLWKIQEWDIVRTIWVGILDIVEYAVWIGFPIVILALLRSAISLKRLRTLRLRFSDPMILSLLVLFLLLSFFGKTVAETGRLWTFLLPLVLIIAVMGGGLFPVKIRKRLFVGILALGLLHTFFLKWLQDFA
ncbi:MAG: hypothetical protein J4G05_03175 [Chlorobi bacterium]|nr:hypothetical protein [Chlorobiota bacterium]